MAASPESNMADFDAIYEEDDDEERVNEDSLVSLVPEPVVIRGAGNMTVCVSRVADGWSPVCEKYASDAEASLQL
ncbi:hypothetical protein HPB48_011381 [Haemaphysalis longicornis]|uniref:Uncharacterized protein n=1 Tax=Haemaphysalis longicornis TaxID=44386 RepID=A0A9J6GFS5_HAELO|nr:hypothetical protein HPB48_011381 [Haemaphysalis longicornis]